MLAGLNGVRILANLIVNQYFAGHRCLLIFSEEDRSFDQNFDPNPDYVGGIPCVRVLVGEEGRVDFDLVFDSFGCQGFVIQSRNQVAVVRELERQIRHHAERYNRRRYLLIGGEEGVFEMEELDFVADFLVITRRGHEAEHEKELEEKQEEIEKELEEEQKREQEKKKGKEEVFVLKTHKYVGSEGRSKVVVLDEWFSSNQSFLSQAILYPDKLGDQQGRELRMATFTYEPYTIVENDTDEYHGTELYSMTEYAKKHNMTPVLVVNEFDYWGEMYPNWTGIGLMGNVIHDRADIGFAALAMWEICYHYLDFSKPLVRTGVAFLVPAPGLAAGWFTPLHSYTGTLWMAMGLVFLLGVAVLALIKYCYSYIIVEKIPWKNLTEAPSADLSSPLWDKLLAMRKFAGVFGGALFSVSKFFMTQALTPNEAPKEFMANVLILAMLVFSLFFTATYSGGLATVMTVPRYSHAINTMEDLVESGLHWGATQDAWIESIKDATDYINVMMVSRFEATSEENLRQYSIEGRFAFSIERLPFENFAIGPYIKRDIIENYRLAREDLYWEQTLIMMRKSSILLPSLNHFIARVFESGIISKIQGEATYLFMDSTIQKVVRKSSHGTDPAVVTKLKMVHVQGAFAILIIGTAFSSVISIFEHLIHRGIIANPIGNKRLVMIM